MQYHIIMSYFDNVYVSPVKRSIAKVYHNTLYSFVIKKKSCLFIIMCLNGTIELYYIDMVYIIIVIGVTLFRAQTCQLKIACIMFLFYRKSKTPFDIRGGT